MEFLASPDYLVRDALGSYTSPKNLSENQFAFTGDWNVMDQYSNPQKGAGLLFNFSAKNVYLVMRAKSGESKVKVFVDDKQQFPGKDVEDGVITVNADTLYELVDLPDPGRHILRLEFLDSNTEVYAFTFG